MATPKQLAALAKARAARAKKKKPITAKSAATGKAPSKRLKKRRAENTKKGYFPNPVKKPARFIVKVTLKNNDVGYLTHAMTLDTDVKKAAKVSKSNAESAGTNYFNANKRYLYKVEVVPEKK